MPDPEIWIQKKDYCSPFGSEIMFAASCCHDRGRESARGRRKLVEGKIMYLAFIIVPERIYSRLHLRVFWANLHLFSERSAPKSVNR